MSRMMRKTKRRAENILAWLFAAVLVVLFVVGTYATLLYFGVVG